MQAYATIATVLRDVSPLCLLVHCRLAVKILIELAIETRQALPYSRCCGVFP